LDYRKVWTSSADFPTYQTDEEQVRADLQYHPDAVKDYINKTLLKALEDKSAAAELGAADADGAKGTVQSVLDSHNVSLKQLKEDLETVAGGGVPSVLQNTSVPFDADSWVTVSGTATLTIAKSEHKRETPNFGYNLYQLVSGTYKSGTWGTAATRVTYNADGSITLTADEAYSGKIVFFGM
jgi:hypothetical protein